MSGVSVLVTAGGTREPIDPVRSITNRSSGRQGVALATVAARLGARVTLVNASDLEVAMDVARAVEVVRVQTAAELFDATTSRAATSDVIIMAAAVADFTVRPAPTKIKRRGGVPSLELEPTGDVVAALVAARHPGQFIVAFAAETTDALAEGEAKLRDKGVDLMVVNDVSAPGAGFEHTTNEVSLLARDVEPDACRGAPRKRSRRRSWLGWPQR